MARPVEALTYTIPETALALKVSHDTVERMISAGKLPAMRIGGRTLVSRKALEAWVDANAYATFTVNGAAKARRL